MAIKTVSVTEAQSNLNELLSMVGQGTEILVTEGTTPVACFISPGKMLSGNSGLAATAPSTIEPLPEGFWFGA